MGLIREPLEINFYVESKSLTDKERELISRHIREYKAKMVKRKNRNRTTTKKKVKDAAK